MFSKQPLAVAGWTFGERPWAETVRRAAAWGYDGLTLPWDSAQTAVSTQAILQEHNLRLFALTPPNVDLAHPDTAVRHQAWDAYTGLLDFAAAVACPLVVVQPLVGRTRPLGTIADEVEGLVTALQHLADMAQTRDLKLAVAVLNRYETHLLNTGAAALAFLERVARHNVGLSLGAFHMNIEEQDAAATIRQVGDRLFLYHMADSNRQAMGRGHMKLGVHLWALEDIGYTGPIIIECLPPGVDVVTAVTDDAEFSLLEGYLQECRRWF